MENIIFSIGHDAKKRRAKNYDITWSEFVTEMVDYIEEPSLGIEFTGSETEEQYARKKKQQNYIAAAVDKVRSNDTVIGRSILYIDLDGATNKDVRRVNRALKAKGLAFFANGTSGDRHDLKGGEGVRAVRYLIPTNVPMAADEIWHCQHSFLHWIGVADMCEGPNAVIDMTANQRARIMFVPPYGAEHWESDGKPVRVTKLLNNGYEPPSELGATNWSEDALANADENSQAIAGWAFEMGLELMGTGRGWAIQCPNHMAHTDNDGTDGSTAIMLPDSIHPEVRFKCQHAHCQELNSHQHLMLHLCGVPGSYLPEAHNISKRQIREMLPFMEEDEVEAAHAAANSEPVVCADADLMDPPSFGKRDYLIRGLMNFKTTFELVGESNIGKSFEMLSRMASVATGTAYMGYPTRRAHCFYFDAEGGEETETRLMALRQEYQDELEWLHVIDMQKMNWDITDPADRSKVIDAMISQSKGEPVGIVTFDSLNQTMVNYKAGSFDENSSTDMGRVAKALKDIAEITGGSTGVVHHPAKSKSGQPLRIGRGSGALHGAVDIVYCLEEAGDNQLNHYMEKARGFRKALPFGIALIPVTIDGLEPEPEAERKMPDASRWGLTQVDDPATYASNETLFAAPVRLAVFESPAAEAGRTAVKETKDSSALRGGDEKAVYAALEQLQDQDDRPQGFTAAEIIKIAGAGGNRRPALKALAERKIITFGRDRDSQLLDGNEGRNTQYRLPTSPNSFDKPQPTVTDSDLEG